MDTNTVVEFVKAAAPVLQKVADDAATLRSEAPGVADALIKAGFAADTERAVLIDALQEPASIVELLKQAAVLSAASPPGAIGRPFAEAGHMSAGSDARAARPAVTFTPGMAAANAQFDEALGVL